MTFFYFTQSMKIHNFFLIGFHFIFVTIIFGGAFIALWHYSKSKLISLKSHKLKKCVYFLISTGIFNFTLGTVHSITYKITENQLFYLAVV